MAKKKSRKNEAERPKQTSPVLTAMATARLTCRTGSFQSCNYGMTAIIMTCRSERSYSGSPLLGSCPSASTTRDPISPMSMRADSGIGAR